MTLSTFQTKGSDCRHFDNSSRHFDMSNQHFDMSSQPFVMSNRQFENVNILIVDILTVDILMYTQFHLTKIMFSQKTYL